MPILTSRKRIKDTKLRSFMPCGKRLKLEYALHIDDFGCQCLECTGQTDFYAMIQSYKDSTDLRTILANIDPNSLNSMVSTFSVDDLVNSGITDFSNSPTTLGGLFNLVKQGENMFNGLPENIRAEFNYSVKNFVQSFGTPHFNEIINKYYTPPTEPTTNVDNQPTINLDKPIEGGNENE